MRALASLGMIALLAVTGTHPAMAGDDADKKAPQNFVYLKPLMFPVVDNGNIAQMVSVTVTLEFDDAKDTTKANAILPRIVDAYLQDLYGAGAKSSVIKNGVLDPMALKSELESSNTRVLAGMPCHVLLDNLGARNMATRS